MCGITGLYAFNEAGRFHLINLQKSIDKLDHRGPDAQGSFFDDRVGLGHRRLSVIDTSSAANQPMTDNSGRYKLIYNGEIYNFRDLRSELEDRYDVRFKTNSDTEVLLYSWIHYGEKCLEKLNGFFAFAVYDQKTGELFIARDRFGIKPLYYYLDDDKLLFASELRSIIAFGIKRNIDFSSLQLYLQLNYIPAPFTILENVFKLPPGNFIRLNNDRTEIKNYYNLDYQKYPGNLDFGSVKKEVLRRMELSVKNRLVADVPLGVFLSGGIDSTIITSIASKYKDNLNTFSVGYEGEKYFDESKYAERVASQLGTIHHTFRISRQEMISKFREIVDHIDEPFADSSAIPVYLLSHYTRNHVTVALSGDGADEILSGYNKHLAFYRARKGFISDTIIRSLNPLWQFLPRSRNNFLSDKFRQLERYSSGLNKKGGERYWLWASLASEQKARSWLHEDRRYLINEEKLFGFRNDVTRNIPDDYSINDILYTDTRFILPNDMLYKVDLMSMAHGLEVRVPFLDHNLVEYVFRIPDTFKINNKTQKMILRDIVKDLIPGNLYKRPKHGFEIPLLNWFRNELRPTIENDLLGQTFIREQEIFDPDAVEKLKKQLFSSSPADAHAHVWALLVFQNWWKKYFS